MYQYIQLCLDKLLIKSSSFKMFVFENAILEYLTKFVKNVIFNYCFSCKLPKTLYTPTSFNSILYIKLKYSIY